MEEKKLRKLTDRTAGDVIDILYEFAPEYAEIVIDDLFDKIYAREGLDMRSREIVTISALISQGTIAVNPQLNAHFNIALNAGMTEEEIKEIILQIAYYAGAAHATNAMLLLKEVINDRG